MSNLRWALRILRRQPGFAATVVLTLAGAVAAVTITFGIATAVLWRPVPFRQADRLAFVWENTAPSGGVQAARVTGYRFHEWQRQARSFSSMALFGSTGFLIERGGAAQIVHGVRVSTNYFDTLGIAPASGRTFADADGEPGAAPVVILSHALWTEWFGGRPDAIGAELRLGGRPFTVIGVMPAAVFPAWPVNPAAVTLDAESRRLWVPIARTPALAGSARAHVFGVVARLADGRSMHDATVELASLAHGTDPDPHAASVRPFRDQFVGDARLALLALLGAAVAVLLVACTNLAALQGSAIERRRAELGVRAALGASRLRLARQFAIEAALLAGSGGVLGVALSAVALSRLPGLLPSSVPLLTPPRIDAAAWLAAIAVSAAAVVALAAWPFARIRAAGSPAPRGTVAAGRGLVFRALVVAQVALAVALAAPAALLQQSLNALTRQDAGFAIDHTLVGQLTLTGAGFASIDAAVAGERRIAATLEAIPGIRGVAFAYDSPLQASWIDSFTISGSAAARDDVRGSAELRIVSPSYFDALGVAITDGRAFTERDDLTAPGVALVNEAYARTLTEGPALNRTLRTGSPRANTNNDPRVPAEFRIVGIVENERFKGLEQPSAPAVYLSTRQFPQRQVAIIARTAGDPQSLAAPVRETLARSEPAVAVERLSSLESMLGDQLITRRGATHVIDGFALAALALAALGLYGLVALLVAARLRETGIRLALGSSPALEAARVVRESVGSTAVGVAGGLGLALVSGRLVQSLLVGVSPHDMLTLVVVASTLVIAAVVAAALPALRAAHVDPATVLRG